MESLNEIMASVGKIFFVGIGGISMSSLAFSCKAAGYTVGGSDRTVSTMTKKLQAEGIPVCHEHRGENISGYDAVVYTSAVSGDTPELAAAREGGIPIIHRAALLGWLMQMYKNRIGVAGTHGKSTTTSMISHVFIEAGRNPSVMCGAETNELKGAYRIGGSDNYFIYEACEYKDAFLETFPTIAVVLNIDLDHTDYFKDISAVYDSFAKFANLPFTMGTRVPMLVACGDDENALKLAQSSQNDVTFGIKNQNCDYVAKNITEKRGFYSFDVERNGEIEGRISLDVLGYHNVYNALAAFAACDVCEIPCDKICSALSNFEGVLRRFEYRGKAGGASVYVDYAHHPTEIAAVLKAARLTAKNKKVIAVFEPHTYSRTEAHKEEFAKALSAADFSVLVDIYAAREENHWGITSEMLADMIPGACYAPSYESAAVAARMCAEPGDVILFIGAGPICTAADFIL